MRVRVVIEPRRACPLISVRVSVPCAHMQGTCRAHAGHMQCACGWDRARLRVRDRVRARQCAVRLQLEQVKL